MMKLPTSRCKNRFRQRLLDWYAQAQRDLPWRKTSDPYRIWISEIMLQQTQVQTVLPYYAKFVEAFPNVSVLAVAPLSTVLKVWEGLGYYARARNLYKAARQIVSEHRSVFPSDLAQVRKLPGIGPYTAAAILSIAFNQDHAVLDGNVNRVLCRVFRINETPKSKEGEKTLQVLAENLLAPGRAGTFNQAIMELGAVVCTPANPKCAQCPLARMCLAKKNGDQHLYPIRVPRKTRPHFLIAAGVIWKDGKLLIARRPENGLLGGLWEFPGGKVEENESIGEAVIREVKEEVGISVRVDQLLTVVKHQYTHFSITLHAFTCRYLAGEPQALGCTEWRWVDAEELAQYAFPRANGKIIEAIVAAGLARSKGART